MESYILLIPVHLLAAYLFRACATDPNPVTSKKREPFGVNYVVNFICTWALPIPVYYGPPLISIYTVLLSVLRATDSGYFNTFCPLEDQRVLDITTRKALGLAIALISGFIRLECYRTLGRSFKFTVQAPKELVRYGIYKYVRHPSYTCVWLLWIAVNMLLQDRNGVIGCFTASRQGSWFDWTMIICTPVLAILRVKNEDNVLRETFGKKWELYAEETAMFIPWVL